MTENASAFQMFGKAYEFSCDTIYQPVENKDNICRNISEVLVFEAYRTTVHSRSVELYEKAIDVIVVLHFKIGQAELGSSEAVLFS